MLRKSKAQDETHSTGSLVTDAYVLRNAGPRHLAEWNGRLRAYTKLRMPYCLAAVVSCRS